MARRGSRISAYVVCFVVGATLSGCAASRPLEAERRQMLRSVPFLLADALYDGPVSNSSPRRTAIEPILDRMLRDIVAASNTNADRFTSYFTGALSRNVTARIVIEDTGNPTGQAAPDGTVIVDIR